MKLLLIALIFNLCGCATAGKLLQGFGQGAQRGARQPDEPKTNYTCTGGYGGHYTCY